MEIVSKILNDKLIEKQGLNEKTVRLIEEKHSELDKIVDMLNGLDWSNENKAQIFQLTESVELIEFQLQKLWGFPQDKNYHTHWLRNKFCSCARMDNRDLLYFGGGKIHRSDCKIHGEENNPQLWQNLKGRDYGEH